MSAPLQQSTRPSFVQQFIQFPRQNVPRTLVYGAVINLAFYYLASQLSRVIEKRLQLHSITSYENKTVVKVVVFGGLTALFNLVQFKLFNYQLGRVVSLAIGIVITAAMTFTYFMLNRKSPDSEFLLAADPSDEDPSDSLLIEDSPLMPIPEVHFIANPEYHQDFPRRGFKTHLLNEMYSAIFTLDKSRSYDEGYIFVILDILRFWLTDVEIKYKPLGPELSIDSDEKRNALIDTITNRLKNSKVSCEEIDEALAVYEDILNKIRSSSYEFGSVIILDH